jgi:hypothetical protein
MDKGLYCGVCVSEAGIRGCCHHDQNGSADLIEAPKREMQDRKKFILGFVMVMNWTECRES